MFKLPKGVPTLKSSAQEWADFAEFLAVKDGKISLHDLGKRTLLISDETVVSGIEDDTDKFNNKTDDISAEINRRKNTSKDRYPFSAEDFGYSLVFNPENDEQLIYRFLLFSTRLNMKKDKIQNGLDGTQIFERLSSEVAKQFFGENAEVDVLGTSKSDLGGFRAKLANLTKRIGEGGEIHENLGYRPQDDKVDVVIWKGFSDKKASQLIAFGQCKTGTSWQETISELNTDAFCKTWFKRVPVITPLRMFFCAQYFPNEIWVPRANAAGLVFDRFSILDYLPAALETELQSDMQSWCNAILPN